MYIPARYHMIRNKIDIITMTFPLKQRFPTGGEFPPRGEFSISQGGNSSLPRFKKNYAQYKTERNSTLCLYL